MVTFPYTVNALRVLQPLGSFYLAVLPAELLLEVCFSDKVRTTGTTDSGYDLTGTQRTVRNERLRAIAEYIDRYDSAFPNSLILAANMDEESGIIEESDQLRWSVAQVNTCTSYQLTIPSARRLAAVIDGQHRLFAFRLATSERRSTELICSVFLDLPKPFQAQLFATINSTQKPVDKSLTYELFGYNIMEEPETYWSPDKLAVFFARKLNVEPDSPLKDRIIVAPLNDFSVDTSDHGIPWRVSMATVVEGLLKLISTNPKRDTNALLTPRPKERSALATISPKDKSVLRDEYIGGNDKLIYLIARNYLSACEVTLWKNAQEGSFIIKTVGIQALFDVLRKLVPRALEAKDVSVKFFTDQLAPASKIDFAGEPFKNASGSGRIEIRKAIEVAIGLA